MIDLPDEKNKVSLSFAVGVALLVVVVLVCSVSILAGLNLGPPYYSGGSTPDGIYRQRSYVTVTSNITTYDGSMYSDLSNNGTTVFFPICDHAYLGPLHGDYHIRAGVVFPENGRYDIKIVNQEIAAVLKYEA